MTDELLSPANQGITSSPASVSPGMAILSEFRAKKRLALDETQDPPASEFGSPEHIAQIQDYLSRNTRNRLSDLVTPEMPASKLYPMMRKHWAEGNYKVAALEDLFQPTGKKKPKKEPEGEPPLPTSAGKLIRRTGYKKTGFKQENRNRHT